MNTQITELKGLYSTKVAEQKSLLDKMRAKEVSGDAMKTMKEQFDALERECSDINSKIDAEVKTIKNEEQLRAMNTPENLPGQGRENGNNGFKSVGQSFVDSDAYKSVKDFNTIGKNGLVVEIKGWQHRGMKTTGSDITIANVPQFPEQVPGISELPIYPPMIMDYMPKFPMASNAYEYFQETTYQNNAGTQVNELDDLVQSGFETDKVTVTAAPVGTWFRITESQLEDQPGLRAFMDQRIERFVDLEAERQILKGTGTNEMKGIINISGIGNFARTDNNDNNGETESNIDAFYRAIVLCQTDGASNPNLGILHSDNMRSITLIKDANSNYIYRRPGEAGPSTLWGIPVVATPHATSGTLVVGDFAMFARLGMRSGLNVVLERSEKDLTQLAYKLRAHARMAFEVTRVKAFTKVTALS
ncbi:MAG: phage major capsid protein [Bacteroidetes bacterium]|nr:phage major capsid protein [Bacteroidota bacterium]